MSSMASLVTRHAPRLKPCVGSRENRAEFTMNCHGQFSCGTPPKIPLAKPARLVHISATKAVFFTVGASDGVPGSVRV